jgi:ABC-type sugar transport system permease subunit
VSRGAPASASRGRAAAGAAFGALIAAALIGVTTGALYLRQQNGASLAVAQAPATAYARALALRGSRAALEAERRQAQSGHAAPPLSPAEMQEAIARLAGRAPEIKLAAVVVEPQSARYRFLRQRRYLAHSDAARVGRVLDRARPGDKAVYDLANVVRTHGQVVETVARPGQPLRVQAATPILGLRGKRLAMALVVTEPPTIAPAPAAWPIAAGLALCVLLGAAGAALLGRRGRYALIGVASAAYGSFCLAFLGRVEATLGGALQQTWRSLAAVLAVTERQVSMGSPPPGSGGSWAVVAATIAALAVGLLGLLGLGARMSAALRRHRYAYAYIAPAAISMLLLVFIPFGYGLGLGFFDHAHGRYTFVGLGNFVEILSGGGRPITHPMNFYFTLGVTVLWTAVNVLLHVSIGLALALVLKDPLLRLKGVYRVLLILPWAVPNYITALIWKGMFHFEYGAVNHLLSLLGVEKVSWFSSFSTAFTADVVTNTWLGFPFMMVVALGALQSIPRDVYEAAAVDGASRWQTFWRITMPLLRPALFPAIVLGSIWTFNMFNIIYLVSGGEPAGATDILITEAYRWAFERADRYGLAAAYAMIIFLILLGYTLITNRLSRATEDVLE